MPDSRFGTRFERQLGNLVHVGRNALGNGCSSLISSFLGM